MEETEEVVEMGKEEMVVNFGMAVGERARMEEEAWKARVLMPMEGMVAEVKVAWGIHMVGGKVNRILRSPTTCYWHW